MADGTGLVIETRNYLLRPLIADDATERYLSWLHNPDVSRTLATASSHESLDDLRRFIAARDNVNSFLFGIFTKFGLHIGTHGVLRDPRHRRASIGTMIGDTDFWGKGVPLESRAAILDFAIDELGCRKLEAGCYSNNLPAIYNFRRQEWNLEGIRKAHAIIDDQVVDLLLFGMVDNEWQNKR